MAYSVWYVDLGIALNLTEPDLGHPDLPDLWRNLYENRPRKFEPGHLQCMQCREDRPECPEWMYLQERGERRVAVHHNPQIKDHGGESDSHKALKQRIASAAEAAGFRAELENRAADGRRRTDVLVHGRDGLLLGAEVQLSYITATSVKKRTKVAVGHGITPLWTTTDRKAEVIDRAPWARVDRMPWHDIANGAELPVRGGLRTLVMHRCADMPTVCPDRGRGRCDKWHATWEPAEMRYDDLIARAAGQEWVPLGYRPSPKREIWHWVSALDRQTYLDNLGITPLKHAADTPARPGPDMGGEAEPKPLSNACMYLINSGLHDTIRSPRDTEQPLPAAGITLDRPNTPILANGVTSGVCCGAHCPANSGHAYGPGCQLCRQSPTYWRTEPGAAMRLVSTTPEY